MRWKYIQTHISCLQAMVSANSNDVGWIDGQCNSIPCSNNNNNEYQWNSVLCLLLSNSGQSSAKYEKRCNNVAPPNKVETSRKFWDTFFFFWVHVITFSTTEFESSRTKQRAVKLFQWLNLSLIFTLTAFISHTTHTSDALCTTWIFLDCYHPFIQILWKHETIQIFWSYQWSYFNC